MTCRLSRRKKLQYVIEISDMTDFLKSLCYVLGPLCYVSHAAVRHKNRAINMADVPGMRLSCVVPNAGHIFSKNVRESRLESINDDELKIYRALKRLTMSGNSRHHPSLMNNAD